MTDEPGHEDHGRSAAAHDGESRNAAAVAGAGAACDVVLLDQSTKWWGWRHVPAAIINSGGDMFVGPMVGGWYADPASGALLDLVSVGLLSGALFGLLRRRSPTVALGSVALMIAGWTSTLLDRLVMHSWTATHLRHIPQRTTPN